jgi:hypothetical protein
MLRGNEDFAVRSDNSELERMHPHRLVMIKKAVPCLA